MAAAAWRKATLTTVSRSLHGQLARFLVVGSCTVAVDFVVYQGLLALEVPVDPAKATSFVLATVLAYVLNRLWTFRSPGGARRALAFGLLYGTTLVVNVGVNAASLGLLDDRPWDVEIAFLIAQACSTTLNFLAMRYVVFAAAGPAGAATGRGSRPAAPGATPPRPG